MNNKTRGRRRHYPEATQRQLAKAFEQRQCKPEEFARRHGVGLSTLYRWIQRPGGPKSALPKRPRFQEVKVPPGLGAGWTGEVCLPDGTLVRWNGASGLAGVEQLVQQLRRSC